MKCKSVVNNFAIYYFFSIFSHLQFYFCRSKNYVALLLKASLLHERAKQVSTQKKMM